MTEGFSGIKNCVFPPDAMDGSLQFLHKLGYSGSLWDMLVPADKKHRRQRVHGTELIPQQTGSGALFRFITTDARLKALPMNAVYT